MSSNNPISLQAKVRFLSVDEGGWPKPINDGMKPTFQIGKISTMCMIYNEANEATMIAGGEYIIHIDLPFGEMYESDISDGMLVTLLVGSRVIAKGKVLKLTESKVSDE